MAIIQANRFLLFGTGAGSMISRKLGAHDTRVPRADTHQLHFFSALLIGFLLTVFGLLFFWKKFMIMLGSTQTILPFFMQLCQIYSAWSSGHVRFFCNEYSAQIGRQGCVCNGGAGLRRAAEHTA